MFRLSLAVAIASLIALFPEAAGSAADGPAWHILTEYERALPGHALPSHSEVHLYAARGEYQAFQIAIPASLSGLQLVNVVSSSLAGGKGSSIPASNITLYREHYVHVDEASPDKHGGNRSLGAGWYPDPLIPFRDPKSGKPLSGTYKAAPFHSDDKALIALWADVFVPRNAAPGDYHSTVTVSTDQGNFQVPWTLTVWNFELPLKPSLHSSFAFWNAGSPDAVEELLRHKLMPQHIAPSPSASLDRILETSDGLTMTDAGFWSGADNSHCSMKPAPAMKDLMAVVAAHDPSLQLFNYTADEVQNCRNLFPALQAWARNLHAAHIKNLLVMVPAPELMDDGTGRTVADIWVVLPAQFDKSPSEIAAARARGNEIWSYNALVQDAYSPKWLIDYDPINYRLQAGFISQSLGLTGLLYWRIDKWDGDVWNHVNNEGTFNSSNYPGDGLLVYPGEPAGVSGVVPSLRLKQLREGVQDFEYVEILKHLGRGDWALSRVRSVAQDWTRWTRNGDNLESVRRELGAEIDKLSGSPNPPVSPASLSVRH